MTPPLSRRSALKTLSAGAAAAAAAAEFAPGVLAADAAARKGRINHSVCKWCYGRIPLGEFAPAAKGIGIQSVELLTLEEIPVVQKHGLTCAMVSGVPGGITRGLNRRENHDAIVAWFEQAAPKVAALGLTNIICFSGNRAGQSDEEGLGICAEGVRRLAPILDRHKVVAVMELLNSKVDHGDYQCDRTKWGVELCKRAGVERFKLLYDIYHMQIMEGDVIRTLREAKDYIAHYHTGGVPGRGEIDESQELFYPAIMRAIVDTGFTGFVAQEFIPKRADVLASLRQGVDICDV